MLKPFTQVIIALFIVFVVVFILILFFIPFESVYNLFGIRGHTAQSLVKVATAMVFANVYVWVLFAITNDDDDTNDTDNNDNGIPLKPTNLWLN